MNFSANETNQVLLKQTLCRREIPDEGYWGWSSVIIYCLAVLTVIANFMLIYVIRNSPTLRKQVLQRIKIKEVWVTYFVSFQRFNLIITSLAFIDLLCGMCFPLNTLKNCKWHLGREFCQVFMSIFVWLMTASVYNFICANLDRCI